MPIILLWYDRIIKFIPVIMGFTAIIFNTPGHAQNIQQVPPVYRGTWAERCNTAAGGRIEIGDGRVSVQHRGKLYAYSGVEFSHTYGEGAHASGSYGWILVSKAPNGMYAFVMTVPGTGRTGPLVIEEGAESEGREVRDLYRIKFQKCH